ncbi:MAG: GEVED domain-containing protein [bacterium]
MKKPLLSNIGFKAIIVAFVLMLFASVGAKSYCYFYTYYGWSYSYNMAINLVKFEGEVIQRWDFPRDEYGNLYYYNSPNFYGYKDVDWNNNIMYAEKGKDFTMEVYGGAYELYEDYNNTIDEYAMYSCNYPQDFKVYVDFNQDGEFDEKSELAGQFDSQGQDCFGKFQISIPSDAQSGQTTMRIVCDYYGNNGNWGPFDACNSYYGEAKDYIIEIKAGFDIGISQITSPTTPLSAGVQPVKAILVNYAKEPVTSCSINWAIDGKPQTALKWKGYLGGGSSVEVTLGTYDFKKKGTTSAYTILAATDSPNGESDGNLYNDSSPLTTVSMPIGPGIYYVGGTVAYDFKTLKEATDLINSTGIMGDGDFVLRMRPGTYDGPFTMDNFKKGNINFVFESDPDMPGLVTIQAATNSSNYVWYLNNMPNVTFRNLTFTVTNPYSYGGRIFMIRGNADNYTFEKNTFNGLTNFLQTPFTYSLIDCQASPMNNHKYLTNVFNYGYLSLSLINSTRNSSGLLIKENKFYSFSNRAIRVEGIANGVISDNLLTASGIPSSGGIYVQNGTEITNNNISGIVGVNTLAAGILVDDNLVSSPAIITGNSITGSTGISGISANAIAGGTISNNSIILQNANLNTATNGITLSNTALGTKQVTLSENYITMENGYGLNVVNYPVEVLKNKIVVSNASSKVTLKSISATGSNGMMLLNEVIGYGQAMELNNSNFTVAYNSTLSLGSSEVMTIDKGSNKIFRNMLVNQGTGNSFSITSANSAVLEGNNYYCTTGTLGKIAGTPYTNPTDMLPFDKYARSADPKYKTNTNLLIVEYIEDLAFFTPLKNVNWPAGYQAIYEENTKDGKFRDGAYYVGAFNIFPVVTIFAFTEELIDCEGAPEASLFIAGLTSEGASPKYQWFKDGDPLPGENSYMLNFDNFDYTVSGTYTCQASCAGAKTKVTDGIPVYALSAPAIVEQPKEVVNAVVGNDYSFNVRVHYRGLVPPYYQDYFQWYKFDAVKNDSIPLQNDDHFAGAKSSELILTNLQASDICQPGDFYFMKVVGQCGTVYSNPFVISETPEVVFRDNPENLNPCPGTDVVFTANAIPPMNYTVTYKWMKDGINLMNDAKYNGVYTNKLQVFDVQAADQGNYVCVAEIPEVPTSKNSNAGSLTLKIIPEGIVKDLADITTKRGNDVTMSVILLAGAEPITIKWYYKDELLKEGVWDQFLGNQLLTLLLESVNENQSGVYKCVLENECASTEVVFNLTVTKWDEAGSVEVISENGYALYACMPNPSTGSTKIRFEMPETDNAVITLIDQTGRRVSTLFNGVANKGMNILDVNTESLNVASGTYFYMISANGFNASLPMVIIK